MTSKLMEISYGEEEYPYRVSIGAMYVRGQLKF
jgi:hypothetical protein